MGVLLGGIGVLVGGTGVSSTGVGVTVVSNSELANVVADGVGVAGNCATALGALSPGTAIDVTCKPLASRVASTITLGSSGANTT